MIDIREPASPAFAGCFADTATGIFGTGYTHDVVCIVYNGPDTAHRGREICLGRIERLPAHADHGLGSARSG